MKKYRRIVSLLLCIIISLSGTSCGKALFAYKDNTEKTEPETDWAIYIYMIGSNLEDRDLNQLSKLTETLTKEQAEYEDKSYTEMANARVRAFSEEIAALGVSLPNTLYNKNKSAAASEKNTDEDALGYGTYSFDMIMDSEIPDGVQFVIQTGGARRWQSSLINPNRSQRFLIDKDGVACVSDDPVVNMCDPQTLEEFMVFCKENYPAKHEMIVFWDHGNAYGGFGLDTIFGEDMLTIREMAGAFENVQALYSQNEVLFDMIGFDACLMGNLETVRLFSDYANYYLASAEELSGLGWGYDRIIGAIKENPAISPYELSCVVAKANVANVQIEGYENVYPATFSVIDLQKIESVYEAYGKLAKSILKNALADSKNLAVVSNEACKTLSYAYGGNGNYNLLDIGVFAENISEYYPNETKELLDALKESVPFLEATTYFAGGSGLSVFFPARMEGLVSLRKFIFYTLDVSDNPIIDALNYYKITGVLNARLSELVESEGLGEYKEIDYFTLKNISATDVKVDGKGNFSMTLPEGSDKLIQNAEYGLIFVDENTEQTVLFSETDKVEMNGLDVRTTNDLTWPALDGNELSAVVLSEDDNSVHYRSEIDYYGQTCYMLFTRDKNSGEYTINGFTLSNDNGTGTAERNVINFDDGDEFSTVFTVGSVNSIVEEKGYFDYVYRSDMKIKDSKLSDGLYIEYVKFMDIRSDYYYSPAVIFTVKNGEVVDQFVDYSLVLYDVSDRK